MAQNDMDRAAEEAERELRERLAADTTCGDLLSWYRGWYKQAGHRRLGRLLVQLGEELAAGGSTTSESAP